MILDINVELVNSEPYTLSPKPYILDIP